MSQNDEEIKPEEFKPKRIRVRSISGDNLPLSTAGFSTVDNSQSLRTRFARQLSMGSRGATPPTPRSSGGGRGMDGLIVWTLFKVFKELQPMKIVHKNLCPW